jgi:hypothetical protein
MKIIRPGVLMDTVELKATCRTCDGIIAVTVADGEFVSDQKDGDFFQFRCPTDGCKQLQSYSTRRGSSKSNRTS